MLNRRSFLSSTAAFASIAALGKSALAESCDNHPPLPSSALFDRDEEAYWAEIRKQFLIPQDEVYLNNGTVGSSPWPVLQAVFDGFRETERMAQANPEEYPIWGYEPYNSFRDPLAAFVGAQRDQIALVRNATEANSYIANGLELKAGDEVQKGDVLLILVAMKMENAIKAAGNGKVKNIKVKINDTVEKGQVIMEFE